MIKKHIDGIISSLDCLAFGDMRKAFLVLIESIKKNCSCPKIHIILSDDISVFAKKIFEEINDIEISSCDFTKISEIDKNIRKNTCFAYCEYPSAHNFRSYDFEKIRFFLSYFKIKLSCGFIFSNPFFCDQTGFIKADYSLFLNYCVTGVLKENEKYHKNACVLTSEKDLIESYFANKFEIKISGEEILKINKSSSNAAKIYDIIMRNDFFKNLKIVHVNSSGYKDYKNNRKISKIDGFYISVTGEEKNVSAAYEKISFLLRPHGFKTSAAGDNIEDYFDFIKEEEKCRLIKIINESDIKSSESQFLIKAGYGDIVFGDIKQ